jgi:TolA-binding protein
MFAHEEEEGERTMVFSPEDSGPSQEPEEPMEKPQGLTVERAAEVIRSIPDEVPYGSAVPIVRLTLEAAGISMGELGTSTRARESKLNSVIEQRQGRIQKLQDDTDKAVRYKEQEIKALEDDIKKFRQARDNGTSQEENKISQARSGLEEVDLVRSFFDLPEEEEPVVVEEPEPAEEPSPAEVGIASDEDTTSAGDVPIEESEDSDEDETQILRRPDTDEEQDMDETQVLRRPGPLSENWNTGERRE